MTKYICLVVFFLTIRNYTAAQTILPIQADRPDQTETPVIVPPKHFQMEMGFAFEKTDDTTNSYSDPAMLLKYGVNDLFEIRLITDFSSAGSGTPAISGLEPVTISFKTKLAEEKGCIPQSAFLGYLSIPSFATENFKETYYSPAFRFSMQHTLSDRFSLGYNAGAEWESGIEEPTFIYTLTTGFGISEKMGSYVELYGFAPQKSKADHRFDCGLTYLLKKNFLIDFSGGAGITENAPDYYLALGFSIRLKD